MEVKLKIYIEINVSSNYDKFYSTGFLAVSGNLQFFGPSSFLSSTVYFYHYGIQVSSSNKRSIRFFATQ
jgi:hypothetical protein